MDEAVSSTQHEQPGLESDPSSAISGLPGNVNLELLQQATAYLNSGISGSGSDVGSAVNEDPGFHEHVNSLRDTMFYVCQGSCLCGTVNNRGKVIYCYGDLVPRHGELFAEGAQGADGGTSSKDLLAAQLGVWTFGIFALLLVLILIRSSIRSMKSHLEKMSNRLPYHFDDDEMSNHSATSPQINDSKTMDTMDPPDLFSDDGTLTPDALKDGEEGTDESPLHLGNAKKYGQTGIPTDRLKKIRINRKDLKKGGDGLRGKNVMDQYRVKDKDMKRTMKWRTPEISMKYLSQGHKSPNIALDKPPDSSTPASGKHNSNHQNKNSAKSKHERDRPRSKPAIYQNETEGSSEDLLDEDDEEVSNVYRKISERREEMARARRNGDDCHVSWYPVSFGSEMNRSDQNNSSNRSASMLNRQNHSTGSASAAAAEKLIDENAILLLDQDQLVAVHCNGNGNKSSSIERARAKRSSKV